MLEIPSYVAFAKCPACKSDVTRIWCRYRRMLFGGRHTLFLRCPHCGHILQFMEHYYSLPPDGVGISAEVTIKPGWETP